MKYITGTCNRLFSRDFDNSASSASVVMMSSDTIDSTANASCVASGVVPPTILVSLDRLNFGSAKKSRLGAEARYTLQFIFIPLTRS